MIFYLYFLPSVLSFNFHPFINPTISISNLALSNLALKKVKQFDINPNITRKAIHIASAPTFISTWNLYNDNYPQFWASSVPLATSLYLITKKNFVSSVISRSGNTSEVLKGPLLYTFILSIMTLYYWTDNPIGLITMSQLSFGDGFADLVGRRYGKTKWIYNKRKSLEGTLGFFITSYIGTNIMISLFNDIKNTHNLFFISLICSLVETIPFIDDNISIPLAVILISNYL